MTPETCVCELSEAIQGDGKTQPYLRIGISGRFHKYGYVSGEPSPTLPVDGEGELPPVNGGIKRGVLWGRPIRSVKAGHPQYVTVFRKRNTKVTARIMESA